MNTQAWLVRGLVVSLTWGAAVAARAAQEPAAVSFEAASVRPARSERPTLLRALPGRFEAFTTPLRTLILMAYGVRPYELSAPSWIDEAFYDISATAGGAATPQEMVPMLRALLTERFGLRAHREQRNSAVYWLVHASASRRLGDGYSRPSPTAPRCWVGA